MDEKHTVLLKILIDSVSTLKQSKPYEGTDQITAIHYDSRNIAPGDIFVAIEGENHNGHDYVNAAISQGATAIFGTRTINHLKVPYFQVEDSRKTLAELSAAFYHFPAKKLFVIGVTGTDGKTTTVNLIYQILKSANINAGMISTVNASWGDESIDTGFHVTTPEAPIIQSFLAKMVDKGITHVVLEATSHGLHQHRVTGCEFNVGVITNITHEHLDYHGDYEHYLSAKSLLLTQLNDTKPKEVGESRIAVINHDDQSYIFLQDILNAPENSTIQVVTYGVKSQADFIANNITMNDSGLSFQVIADKSIIQIESPLIGEYNVSNILAAIAATDVGLRIPFEQIIQGVNNVKYIPGRMEKIDCGQNFTAIVDFAHTPNALKVALQTSRRITNKRVIAVFGCAGLRDRQKRIMMPEISVDLADVSLFTAEDPRTESLDSILGEMKSAAEKNGYKEDEHFILEPDRGEAIRKGVSLAQKGDVVIICGKGHEQSMCFGTEEFAWDDRIALHAALAELLGQEGPKMPFLPTQKIINQV